MTHYQTPPAQRRMERFCGLVFGLWLGLYLIDTAMHPKPSNLPPPPPRAPPSPRGCPPIMDR
jgi:hypothetical protein